jgi:glutathione S-transferase
LALAEANIQYKAYQIDLFNKPEWFAAKVNPIGKVCTELTVFYSL